MLIGTSLKVLLALLRRHDDFAAVFLIRLHPAPRRELETRNVVERRANRIE
jgi:hypothetical protein